MRIKTEGACPFDHSVMLTKWSDWPCLNSKIDSAGISFVTNLNTALNNF